MSRFEELKDEYRANLYPEDPDDLRAAAHALGYLMGNGYEVYLTEALEDGKADGDADRKLAQAAARNEPPF